MPNQWELLLQSAHLRAASQFWLPPAGWGRGAQGFAEAEGEPSPCSEAEQTLGHPSTIQEAGHQDSRVPPCMCVGGGGEQSPISCICPLPARRQQPPHSGSWRSGRGGFHTLCPFALRAACCSVHAFGGEEHATEQPPLPTARRAAKETGPAPAVPLSC